MALNNEAKAAIIQQRLDAFEAEKFQHELNRDVAVAINNADAALQSDAAIAQLDAAIAVHETQLAIVAPVIESVPVVVDEPSA